LETDRRRFIRQSGAVLGGAAGLGTLVAGDPGTASAQATQGRRQASAGITDAVPSVATPDWVIQNVSGTWDALQAATGVVAFSDPEDVTAVLQNVLDTTGTDGGYIYFAGSGEIPWGVEGSSIPVVPAGIGGFARTPTGWLRIGAAPGITLALTVHCPRLLSTPAGSATTYQTMQNILLEDLVVDAGGTEVQGATGNYHLIFGPKQNFGPLSFGVTALGTSWRNIVCRRLRGYGAPTDPTSAVNRTWVYIASAPQSVTDMVPVDDAGPDAGGPLTIQNILIEDCEFYGGNSGVAVIGEDWPGGTPGSAGAFPAGYPAAATRWPGGYNPVWLDQVHVERVRHEATYEGVPMIQGGRLIQRRFYLSEPIGTTATTITSDDLVYYPTLAVHQTLALTCRTAGYGEGVNLPRYETMTMVAHTRGETTAVVVRGSEPLAFRAGDYAQGPAWGANFQIGSQNQGGVARVTDCHAYGGGDVTFEFDNWQDLVMSDCTAVDGQGSSVYLTNRQPLRYPDAQRATLRAVRSSRIAANQGYGFSADCNSSGIPLGAILYHDCHYYRNPASGAESPANGYHAAEFGGWAGNQNIGGGGRSAPGSDLYGGLTNEGFRYAPTALSGPLTLRDCSSVVEGVTVDQDYNATEFLVNINRGATYRLVIDGLLLSYSATVAATNGGQPQISMLELACSDTTVGMTVDISRVHLALNLVGWPSTCFVQGIHFNQTIAGQPSLMQGGVRSVTAIGTGALVSGGQLSMVEVENGNSILAGSYGRLICDGLSDGPNLAHTVVRVHTPAPSGWISATGLGSLRQLGSGTYQMRHFDRGFEVDASGGPVQVQLLNAAAFPGLEVAFVRIDTSTNVASLATVGVQTIAIPGQKVPVSTLRLAGSLTLRSDGANWVAIVRSGQERTLVAADYTVEQADELIAVAGTTGPVTVTLLRAGLVAPGTQLTIKDESGQAADNPITVAAAASEQIDGSPTAVITTAYGVLRLYCTGAGWGLV